MHCKLVFNSIIYGNTCCTDSITWLFACSSGLFVYYVKCIRLFNLILFCYFDFYIIQNHRHIFTRTTNFLPAYETSILNKTHSSKFMWNVKRKKSERRQIDFRIYLFVSFYLYFYLFLMLIFMHHYILSKPFSVISLTVKFENQSITKRKYFSLIMNLK